MAKINEEIVWEPAIYKLTTETPVLGFDSGDNSDGPSNIQAQQLANRTAYLKSSVDGLQSGDMPYANVATAQAAINDGTIPLNAVFTVRGQTAELWLLEYQNINSIVTPVLDEFGVQRSSPATAFVNQVRDLAVVADDRATSVDRRTQGFSSTSRADDILEFVTITGKKFGRVDDTGMWHLPGGVNVNSLDILKILLGDNSISQGATGNYIFSLIADNRRPFGLRNDGLGTIEYQGIPLTNIRGQLPNVVAYAGDSISAFTEATTGGFSSTVRDLAPLVCAQGWPIWAQHSSNGLVRYSGVYATGGFTTAQILQTHIPRVIASKPSLCVVLAGRNDIYQRINLGTTLGNFRNIFTSLRQAGIVPVVCTLSAQSGNDAQQKTLEASINNWLVSYANKYGLPLVDLHSATINPQTGEWIAGYNYDASHPKAIGAQAMGQRLSETLIKWIAPTYPRIAVEQSVPATHPNQIPNPLFYTNDGVNPEGWTVITPGISSIDTDADVKGKVWQLANGADRSITIPVVSGASYGFGFMFKTISENNCEVYIVAGSDRNATGGYLAGIKNWQGNTGKFGVFYDEFTVPEGISVVTVCIRSDGTALSLGQMSLPKLEEV